VDVLLRSAWHGYPLIRSAAQVLNPQCCSGAQECADKAARGTCIKTRQQPLKTDT